ncbi:MAG: tyrosine-type recombinase/integrase [Leptospiraceae bacterium]|nr:tyrosine-type recombinase/integrase [Leptospiraceae bacterium]
MESFEKFDSSEIAIPENSGSFQRIEVTNKLKKIIDGIVKKPEQGEQPSSYRGIATTYRKFSEGKDDLETFKNFLLSKKYKSSTKENLYNMFRAIIKKSIKDKNLKDELTESFSNTYREAIEETKKSENRIEKEQDSMNLGKDYLSKDDIKKVCEYIEQKEPSKKNNTDPLGNIKLSQIIRFLFQTGCRLDELIQIRKSEILLNGVAKIKLHGKGSKSRYAEIERNFYEEINKTFKGKEFLFESKINTKLKPQNLWKKITDSFIECGYGNRDENLGEKFLIHPHTMRHSFAMHKLEGGMDIKTLSYLLGHSDISITLRTYIHPNTEKYKELIHQW